MGRMDGQAIPFWGKDAMASQKERPANVPEENVYKSIHWMVILTYVVAISGVTILLVNAG
tara:strand:- start:37 stop:216 length:180 start_codon:yes stop_codon:yes gene_type:complete